MRLYIGTPYLVKFAHPHNTPRLAQNNVDLAIEIFHNIKKLGHTPFVPVLSHYLHIHHTCPEDYGDWFYGYDLTFLERWAEGLVLSGNWKNSEGCLIEKEFSIRLGIPIFTTSDRGITFQELSITKSDIEQRLVTITCNAHIPITIELGRICEKDKSYCNNCKLKPYNFWRCEKKRLE